MSNDGIFRRRNLPHVDVDDKPFFITACLQGSIPAHGLKQIQVYREHLDQRTKPPELHDHEWNAVKHKLVFKFVDAMLDGNAPVRHLADDRLAEIVQNAFLYFAEERYHLFGFVIMPSHHHGFFFQRTIGLKSSLQRRRVSPNAKLLEKQSLIAFRVIPETNAIESFEELVRFGKQKPLTITRVIMTNFYELFGISNKIRSKLAS